MATISDIVKTLSPEEQTKLQSLLAKAADETIEGIIISDASLPDNPLIYVNDGFVNLTGYSKDEVLGKNCRFLQGPDKNSQAAAELRSAINQGRECKVDILNYRKDGSQFWNRLSITPIRGQSGQVVNFVGVQFDITELTETRQQLEAANQKLALFHKEMNIELDQARRAQQAILPEEMPFSSNFQSAARFVPLSHIGGDFYDAAQLTTSSYGFLIADVTGHGIPAALLTFMSATAFKNAAPGILSTCDVITDTNNRIVNKMTPGAFVSMFYMIYNEETHELSFTQAGHPPAILLRPSKQEVQLLRTNGSLVGIFPDDMVSYGENKVELQPGDKIILYTDAIIETIGHKHEGEEFSLLTSHILKNRNKPIGDLLDSIYDYALGIGGLNAYQDDATLLGLEVFDN
mgnify:CR=1 FL=1